MAVAKAEGNCGGRYPSYLLHSAGIYSSCTTRASTPKPNSLNFSRSLERRSTVKYSDEQSRPCSRPSIIDLTAVPWPVETTSVMGTMATRRLSTVDRQEPWCKYPTSEGLPAAVRRYPVAGSKRSDRHLSIAVIEKISRGIVASYRDPSTWLVPLAGNQETKGLPLPDVAPPSSLFPMGSKENKRCLLRVQKALPFLDRLYFRKLALRIFPMIV